MELIITTKNIENAESLKDYLNKKLGKLEHRLPNVLEAKVEISQQRARAPEQRYVVQLTINSNGSLLRAEERASALYTAIDKVAAVMDRQIERFKSRLHSKGRGMTPVRAQAEQAPMEEAPAGKVVKVKRFVVKPMSPEEAADEMELLGHDFFLFYNEAMRTFNLLYRRKDGDYGLIVPEIG